jgi:hypothetical protein
MSLAQKINALTTGITDSKVKLEIAKTINFLFGVYCSGRASEEEIRSDLIEVCSMILQETHPELLEEDIRKRANFLAEELLRTMKIEGLSKRALARYQRYTIT